METKLLEMDKLQRSDHDTLIRLEGKVDSLILNVAALQLGTDTRIKEIEKQLEANTLWIHDFRSTYKVIGVFASGVGAIVSFILTTLALKSELFK